MSRSRPRRPTSSSSHSRVPPSSSSSGSRSGARRMSCSCSTARARCRTSRVDASRRSAPAPNPPGPPPGPPPDAVPAAYQNQQPPPPPDPNQNPQDPPPPPPSSGDAGAVSTGNRKIDVAQAELIDALVQLPAGTRMNVLFFNSGVAGIRADHGLARRTESRGPDRVRAGDRAGRPHGTRAGDAPRIPDERAPDRAALRRPRQRRWQLAVDPPRRARGHSRWRADRHDRPRRRARTARCCRRSLARAAACIRRCSPPSSGAQGPCGNRCRDARACATALATMPSASPQSDSRSTLLSSFAIARADGNRADGFAGQAAVDRGRERVRNVAALARRAAEYRNVRIWSHDLGIGLARRTDARPRAPPTA